MVKIHPIFYILVLCPTTPVSDTLPRQIQDPPLPVKVDSKDKYFVKRIDNIKYNKWKRQYIYLMKWRGYTEPLWEPVNSIGLTQATKDFYKLYLELPQPCLTGA